VGRKRDLHDSMLYREGAGNGDSSDEERSHKRVKETHLHSSNTNTEPNLASYISPPSLQEPAEVDASNLQHGKQVSESSREETDKAEPAKQSMLEFVGDGSDVSQAPAEVLNNAVSTTWNQGVQSGLRTSFGSKSKRRSRLVNSNSLVGDEPDTSLDPATSTLQEDPMQVDDTSRSSDDKNAAFMGNSKFSTNNETQALSAQRGQIEVLSSQDLPTHQEPQHHISEAQSHPEDNTRDTTNAREDSGPLQSNPSSSKEDESHSEANGHDGTAELGGLPTASPTSEQPKKFRLLSKREFRFLTAPQKQAYELEAAAHKAKAQDSRVHTARRALLEDRTDKPLKKLSPAALDLLDPQEREDYLAAFEAKKVERQRGTFEEVTQNATDYLTNGSNNSTILSQINNGFTFYPRKCNPAYQKNKVKFPLSEVLDQGKPIHIERFSFNVFAPAFLAAHRSRRHLLSQKNLIAAFHLYINTFYSHVLQFGFADRLRATATAGDALTMEQATHLADMGLSGGLDAFNNPLVTNGGDQGTASSSLLPSEDGVKQTTAKDDDTAMGDVVQAEAKDLTEVERPLPEELESTDSVMDEAEIYLQQKYFPGSASTIRRCLSCGHLGHNSSTCPALACTSCSTFGKHPTASCPLNARCGKCRERGHSTKDCPEKLARSKGEAVPCDLCGSKDHLEMACNSIWRSYDPRPEEIRTVRDIPAHCYMCGKSDHYGPECGLHRGRLLSGGSTWSTGNLQRYVDPASRNRALSAGIDYSIPPRSSKQFSIKGKANDPIELDDSDDGEDFIRAKVKPPVQSGHIQFGGASGRLQSNPVNVSYRPAQLPQPPQHGFNRPSGPSGPPQGMQPRSMPRPPGPPGPPGLRGPNNGGGGKKGPNIKKKKGGPPEAQAPGKKRRRQPKA
jgi:hypothetical protein